jgi:hypothetical protein
MLTCHGLPKSNQTLARLITGIFKTQNKVLLSSICIYKSYQLYFRIHYEENTSTEEVQGQKSKTHIMVNKPVALFLVALCTFEVSPKL